LLAMEPSHMMFILTQNSGALGYLDDNCASFRMSLYVDDGLTTNLEKN
jgi:hypothetical protein